MKKVIYDSKVVRIIRLLVIYLEVLFLIVWLKRFVIRKLIRGRNRIVEYISFYFFIMLMFFMVMELWFW